MAAENENGKNMSVQENFFVCKFFFSKFGNLLDMDQLKILVVLLSRKIQNGVQKSTNFYFSRYNLEIWYAPISNNMVLEKFEIFRNLKFFEI